MARTAATMARTILRVARNPIIIAGIARNPFTVGQPFPYAARALAAKAKAGAGKGRDKGPSAKAAAASEPDDDDDASDASDDGLRALDMDELRVRMGGALDYFKKELVPLRLGRAQPGMLDHVTVPLLDGSGHAPVHALGRVVVRDPPRVLAERDGARVQLLYIVDRANHERALAGERERVGEGGGGEGREVVRLARVDVCVVQLEPRLGEHGRAVGRAKGVARAAALKRRQRHGLRAERHALALGEARRRHALGPARRVHVRDDVPVAHAAEQVGRDAERHEE
jgi:hypothetical protein